MDGEVCDCTRLQAADPQDKTVVLNTENVQNTQRAAGSPEENYEQRIRQQQAAQGQPYQNGPQNQQWQNRPQNQQWQNGPQGQPYQNGPQNGSGRTARRGSRNRTARRISSGRMARRASSGRTVLRVSSGRTVLRASSGRTAGQGPAVAERLHGQQWQNSPRASGSVRKKTRS